MSNYVTPKFPVGALIKRLGKTGTILSSDVTHNHKTGEHYVICWVKWDDNTTSNHHQRELEWLTPAHPVMHDIPNMGNAI
jgi:hypothetical protein